MFHDKSIACLSDNGFWQFRELCISQYLLGDDNNPESQTQKEDFMLI